MYGKHSLKKKHGIWFLLLFLINSWWRVYLTRTHCGGPVSIQLFAAWLVNCSSKFQGYSHVVKRNDNTLSQTNQDLKCQVGLFGWAFTHIMGSFGLSNTFLCMFSPSRCDGWFRSCDQPGARCWRDRDQRPVPWSWSGTFGCESRPYFHSLHGRRHCGLHRAISWVARMRPTGQAGLDLVCLPLSRRALDLPTCCCCRAWSSTGSTPNCCSYCWPGTWCITCCPCWSSRRSGLHPIGSQSNPSVDQLDKVQRHVESLALRTTDMLESIGFNSPDALTEAKTILWSGLPDLTAADIQALKARRVDRSAAAAEMTTEWDWRGVAIRSSQFFCTYSSFFFSGMQF